MAEDAVLTEGDFLNRGGRRVGARHVLLELCYFDYVVS